MVSLVCPNFDRTNVKRKLESDALLGVHVIRLWLILYRSDVLSYVVLVSSKQL